MNKLILFFLLIVLGFFAACSQVETSNKEGITNGNILNKSEKGSVDIIENETKILEDEFEKEEIKRQVEDFKQFENENLNYQLEEYKNYSMNDLKKRVQTFRESYPHLTEEDFLRFEEEELRNYEFEINQFKESLEEDLNSRVDEFELGLNN